MATARTLSRRSFMSSAGAAACFSSGCVGWHGDPTYVNSSSASLYGDWSLRGRAAFEQTNRLGLPGAIIAVQRGDAPLEIRAYGVADQASDSPMTADMWMRIGSVSKLFVGHIVLKLADSGALSLDQPVSDFRDDVPNGEKITLQMLGNHTSGLYNPIESREFRERINREPSRRISREEMFEVAWTGTSPDQQIGVFRYSNTNTALLADVAERSTGLPIEALLEELVLNPADVVGLRFAGDHTLPEPFARGYRYGPNGGGVEYGRNFFDATNFSASWADAAGDMQGQIDGVLKAALHVIKAEGVKRSIVARQREFINIRDDFGYGFCLASYNGWLGHAGDVPGFSAFAGWQPDANLGLAILTNLSNFRDKSSPANALRKLIFPT
ncbi:MAG: serine hydrolase domain-containing protein [Pseudomonadota bacterium]